jgi:hypothetical protein
MYTVNTLYHQGNKSATLLLMMYDDSKIPTIQKIEEACRCWKIRFGTEANVAEMHHSVDLTGVTRPKTDIRHAVLGVPTSAHVFFVTRIAIDNAPKPRTRRV